MNMYLDLKQLSTYRQELMGLAMLMVVFHHMPIPQMGEVIGYLHGNGGFGVDIFLLLSGMGLYYSARKGLDLGTFYRRRLIRIMPVYIVVVGITSLIWGDTWQAFLYKVTTIGYWTGDGCYDWYVPTLVALYLIYPLFHALIHKSAYGIWFGLAVVVALWTLFFCLPHGVDYQMLMRVPVFFLGAVIAKVLINNELTIKGGVDTPALYRACSFYLGTHPL